MKLEKMLVATDLSENSGPVYTQARALAQRAGARVTLLFADEVSELTFPAVNPGTAARWRQVLDELAVKQRSRLGQAVADFEGGGVEVELVTTRGNPVEVICERAGDDVDLVVMGKRGVRMIAGVGIGRTTKRVLRRSPVPVLVVPESAALASSFERLIATTNFTPSCAAGLRHTLELAQQLDAMVEYVHVIRLPVPFSFASEDWADLVPSEARQETQHTLAGDLSSLVGEADVERCQPVSAIGVSVSETLRDLAAESGASLVAIPARGKRRSGLFGSTAENVIKLSRVPVLVYPVGLLEEHGDSRRGD